MLRAYAGVTPAAAREAPAVAQCRRLGASAAAPIRRAESALPAMRRLQAAGHEGVALCATPLTADLCGKGFAERLRLGRLEEDGLSYKESFIVRCYEVGINKTATVETIANLLQEVGCNHAQSVGFSTDGFATTNTMRALRLIWVTSRMHIEIFKYPAWGDIVEIETWCQGEGRIGTRRDWILKDMATDSVIGRATRIEIPKKPFTPPREVHEQITHSLSPQKVEIFKSLENWAKYNILIHLKPVEKSWQPQDFLPDASAESFHDEVNELRERSKEIPDDYFVCLVGDMITEEALPTYQTMLNTLDGVRDETGASPTSWAVWTRAWTAEENRHGDLLNKYLYLTGRVDMKQIERTIQYLIGSGMDPRTENNPYLGFIYTSFQERATFISHGNTARHAKEHGDLNLAQVCGIIASDEKRHETAYTKIIEKLFEIDPDGTVLAFADMMKKKISMPAHLMFDGRDDNLFEHFSMVAQRLGIYTAKDYADILEFLVSRWKVAELSGLSSEGNRAQDFVCTLVPRIRRIEERAQGRAKQGGTMRFSWIHDREVML